MPSVYATPNKSDTPGEAHRGLTNDTRFGMSGKPSYNNLSQAANREDNIHRLTLQAQIQSGASRDRGRGRGRRGGRGGRQPGPQPLARIPQQYCHHYSNPPRNLDPRELQPDQRSLQEDQSGLQETRSDFQKSKLGTQGGHSSFQESQSGYQTHRPRIQSKHLTGMSRGQQKGPGRSRGAGGRGKRRDTIYTHARFQSQVSLAYAADTPRSEFVFPIINDSKTDFALQDYEDEGPSMPSPYGGYGQKDSFDDGYDEEGSADGVSLENLKADDENVTPLQHDEGHQAREVIAEELETLPQTLHAASAPTPVPTRAPAVVPTPVTVLAPAPIPGLFPALAPGFFPGPPPAPVPVQMSQGTWPPNIANYPSHFVAPHQFVPPGHFGPHFVGSHFAAPNHFVGPHFVAPHHPMIPHHMVGPHPFALPHHYIVHQGGQPVTTGRLEGFPPPLPAFQTNQDSVGQPVMKDHKDNKGEKYIPEFGHEYARYLDELNEESRARGDLVLEGDLFNERLAMGHLPTDSVSSLNSFDAARERERRGSPTMNNPNRRAIIDAIRAGRRRPGLRGASARRGSPAVQGEDARLSTPPRDRPVLLSPIHFSSRSTTVYERWCRQ